MSTNRDNFWDENDKKGVPRSWLERIDSRKPSPTPAALRAARAVNAKIDELGSLTDAEIAEIIDDSGLREAAEALRELLAHIARDEFHREGQGLPRMWVSGQLNKARVALARLEATE